MSPLDHSSIKSQGRTEVLLNFACEMVHRRGCGAKIWLCRVPVCHLEEKHHGSLHSIRISTYRIHLASSKCFLLPTSTNIFTPTPDEPLSLTLEECVWEKEQSQIGIQVPLLDTSTKDTSQRIMSGDLSSSLTFTTFCKTLGRLLP